MKKLIQYLKSLIKSDSGDSSKSFALLLSIISGFLMSLCVSFVMIWDVVTNNYMKTNLSELGLFVLCIGGFMAGGGLSKTVSDYKQFRQNI